MYVCIRICILSAAFPNACSVAFSNSTSLVSGIFQRIAACPVDLRWNCPMDFQWHVAKDFCVCDFWCATFGLERQNRARQPTYGRFPYFQSSNSQFESLKSEQINCGCFFDTMSDFNVPGSRPKKNTMKFRKSTVAVCFFGCHAVRCFRGSPAFA